MVQRERVADNIYFFQSEQYAQVTAGVVVGPSSVVVIDTLAFPDETVFIRDFITNELKKPVDFIINTHSHADHTWGNYLFPNATIIGHTLCRSKLLTEGVKSLKKTKESNPSYAETVIVAPQLTFSEGCIRVYLGKKILTVFCLPGHSEDGLAVLIEADRVLFAGDVFMSLPYVVGGDIDVMVSSLKEISKMGLENVVQGHGEIILRGEIDSEVKENLAYLSALRKAVRKSGRRKYPMELFREVNVESCGKSRVLLGSFTEDLHQRNLVAIYRQMYGKEPARSPVDPDDLDFI